MEILIETTRISYRTKEYQIGYSFISDKRKVKRAALEWDDFVIQKHLKSLLYVNRSLRGDPNKEKLIDELNFKNCMRLSRKKK